MSFRNWIASIFGGKKPEGEQVPGDTERYIQKLKNEIAEISKEHRGLINEYEEVVQKLKNEIAEINYAYQKAKNKHEKEREIKANLEKELENERKINSELRKDVEARTPPSIKAYEESIQKLNKELAEMNNRYQEAIERLNTEMENTISLEMLILELDRELGLMDTVKKLEKI